MNSSGDYILKITENIFTRPTDLWKVLRILRIVLTAIILIAMLILIFIPDQTMPNNPPKNLKNPSMVWYSKKFWWAPVAPEIVCSNGSKVYKCDILSPEDSPENPDAYLFYALFINKLPLPRDPQTIWGLLHEESPNGKLELLFEKALNLFNFSATLSRYSDVPLPLLWMAGFDAVTNTYYFVNTFQKNYLLSEIAPVVYMQSDCDTSTERDEYVKKLMEYIKVDAYGVCLHNKELPLKRVYRYLATDGFDNRKYLTHLFDDKIMEFIARYKFIIAIENGVCNDYVTEKFWRAIELGVVPIYYGSPLIRDWLPNNKSAILLEDFPTPELLSRHLHYLLSNDTAYEEYLEHKTLQRISNQKLLNEMNERPYQTDFEEVLKKFHCLICQRIHDRNSSRVDIVTKKHYDCPFPTTALSLSANTNSSWLDRIEEARVKVDLMYEEFASPNKTLRATKTGWW